MTCTLLFPKHHFSLAAADVKAHHQQADQRSSAAQQPLPCPWVKAWKSPGQHCWLHLHMETSHSLQTESLLTRASYLSSA